MIMPKKLIESWITVIDKKKKQQQLVIQFKSISLHIHKVQKGYIQCLVCTYPMRQNLELLEMTSPSPLNIIRSMPTVVLSLD